MAPSKAPASWDDEESGSSAPSSPPVIARRSKFEDEEDDDVLDSWDAGDDSDAEREKAKKAEEAKAKADAEAKKNHKSKSQRVEEHRQAKMRQRQLEEDEEDSDEDEETRLERARANEKESDLQHAEDLFDGIGISNKRSAPKAVTIQEGSDPSSAVDLSKLSIFNPKTAPEFSKMRDTLVPLLTANAKKPQYALFLPEFAKQLSRDLSSDQIKKISSALTTLSNEKLKEEKAADKGGKKSKAAKTKSSLAGVEKPTARADTLMYEEDGLGDDDFM
ncbi:eukaryotic translation initiation factor 3 subunit J [Polychaeton citri CBS 116435]|uniref:Eukaryotic translation initiation factor 3 subunit J n=1 Tax=Polychaeton citri CBS 116435 TaxID=1314669 RepID=A0A9P4Q6M0_9PEZI|nr:eukaryotic translation initiation factor 3 subunit J [Polychaeton citri CBS 116435]